MAKEKDEKKVPFWKKALYVCGGIALGVGSYYAATKTQAGQKACQWVSDKCSKKAANNNGNQAEERHQQPYRNNNNYGGGKH